MAIGLTPKYIEDYYLNELTPHQFLILATEVVSKLKYKLSYISENGLIAYTDNQMFSWNAEIKVKIEKGVAHIQSASTGGDMIDFGKNKKNIAHFIATLDELKQIYTTEELDAKYQEISNTLISQEEDILTLPPATTAEQISATLSGFKPTQGFFITPILIYLNIIIFILMVIGGASIIEPGNEILLKWGANFRPTTLAGEWWRLITSCFLHIGIIHLIMNMYALAYIGVLLEPHLGRIRFLVAFLLTGITASIASIWWHDYTISAGASGAIFGMYGVFLAMLTTNYIEKTARKNLLTSIGVFVVFNLMYGLQGGIDNAAHIGGLLGGLIIGYAYIPSLKKTNNNLFKWGTIVLLSILTIASSFLVYKILPNDIGLYEKKMREFVSLESKAIAVYNLPPNSTNNEVSLAINEGRNCWKENIKLLDSCKELDLPTDFRTRIKLLKEYCELRIKSYDLMYKANSENTNRYDLQIVDYNNLILAKINEIDNVQMAQSH